MRTLVLLCLIALFSCESSVESNEIENLNSSEARIGGVGGAIDIDIDKSKQHRALAFYKKVVVPGSAPDWQSTYTYKSIAGYGNSHAAARANAESQSAGYGWSFTYSSCLSGPGH